MAPGRACVSSRPHTLVQRGGCPLTQPWAGGGQRGRLPGWRWLWPQGPGFLLPTTCWAVSMAGHTRTHPEGYGPRTGPATQTLCSSCTPAAVKAPGDSSWCQG